MAAAVRAYRAGGVGATAKHFPGLGAATSNTDDAPASVPLTPTDLEPFKAAIAAGVPLVMASHALYPNVDRRNLASQSPALLRDLLRGRLRYRGTIITDSMEAQAVTSRSSRRRRRPSARWLAGADLILMTGDGSFRPVSLSLLARARRDRAFRARVRDGSGAGAGAEALAGAQPAESAVTRTKRAAPRARAFARVMIIV